MTTLNDFLNDTRVPPEHRVYLMLRVFVGLRQREVSRIRMSDFKAGLPLPCLSVAGSHEREVPVHPSLVLFVQDWAGTRGLNSEWLLFRRGDARRIEADWGGGLGEIGQNWRRAEELRFFRWVSQDRTRWSYSNRAIPVLWQGLAYDRASLGSGETDQPSGHALQGYRQFLQDLIHNVEIERHVDGMNPYQVPDRIQRPVTRRRRRLWDHLIEAAHD